MSRRRQSKRRVKSLMWMIVLTGMLSIFSTYAWFSTNRVVTISNINAKVAAAEGLQISLDGENWSSSIDFAQTSFYTLADDGVTKNETAVGRKNNYNWPDQLNPVSTGGTTSTGDLLFYAGEVKDDGLHLENTSANETNLISFDLYFKNASSGTTDFLQLNGGSSIVVHDATLRGATGLEYSVRMGLLLYGNTAALTADGSTVRDLTAGTPRVSIWEPNAGLHIGEIIANDGRVTASPDYDTAGGETIADAFETLGLIGIPQSTDAINVASKTAETFLQKQHTLKTASGEVAGATYMPLSSSEAEATSTAPGESAAADYLSLGGNTITKARVYIWLEGQDPDCVDTASTGKQLDINLSFTKPSNG